MEIQTSMLNLLALKFWQLMETYAENHSIGDDLVFISCSVIVSYVYLTPPPNKIIDT